MSENLEGGGRRGQRTWMGEGGSELGVACRVAGGATSDPGTLANLWVAGAWDHRAMGRMGGWSGIRDAWGGGYSHGKGSWSGDRGGIGARGQCAITSQMVAQSGLTFGCVIRHHPGSFGPGFIACHAGWPYAPS